MSTMIFCVVLKRPNAISLSLLVDKGVVVVVVLEAVLFWKSDPMIPPNVVVAHSRFRRPDDGTAEAEAS